MGLKSSVAKEIGIVSVAEEISKENFSPCDVNAKVRKDPT
jgi:hypothetical protein